MNWLLVKNRPCVSFFNPPFYANIISILLVLLHAKFIIPSIILNSADLLGSAAVPVATFVLAAVLGSIPFNIKPYLANAGKVMLIKLIIVLLATIIVLRLLNFYSAYPLLCSFLTCSQPLPFYPKRNRRVYANGGYDVPFPSQVSSLFCLTWTQEQAMIKLSIYQKIHENLTKKQRLFKYQILV